jgi:5,5'-dehydrodivanillate O-demethylase
MGNLLRRYWMPIAGVSEFDATSTKPIRLMGEDLVLYKDLGGTCGLVQRQCPHRRADLSFGMVEAQGLRCSYHGWQFDHHGACIHQPFEDTAHPERQAKARVQLAAYPVQVKGGMLWAYMGPQPAPLLPDWEAFSWDNGFTQVVLSEVPCNWFQCQENSIDPVHFEWMHENWGNRQRTGEVRFGATHLKLDFKEFEFGFTYHRVKQDTSEDDQACTVGRVC